MAVGSLDASVPFCFTPGYILVISLIVVIVVDYRYLHIFISTAAVSLI